MSILDEILLEENDRLARGISLLREEASVLPKGYISKKKIGNNTYFYLQKREQEKIVSKHIKQDEVESYRALLQRRKEIIKKVKELQLEQEKIAAAQKKAKINE